MMKRVLVSGVATGMMVLGAVQLTMPVYADVLKGDTVAKTTIEAGELLISAPSEIDFGPLKLGGAPITAAKPGEIEVSDYRGNYAGWNVTVAKADAVTWDNAMEIKIGEAAALNKDAQDFAAQAKADKYDLVQKKPFTANLNVPNVVKAGAYNTTLTWTLGTGPEGK